MKQSKRRTRRIAIVTGGTSGLGFAIAKKLISKKILTIVTGRDSGRLKETKRLLGELCIPSKMDLTVLRQIPPAIKKIKDRYGRIDILVNNAGINLKKDLVQVTDEEFQKIVSTNLTGVFAITREVAKTMIAQKNGAIINISSMAAHYGIPKVTAYSASKSAIEGMTRSLAVDLSPHRILVNCIAPGFIKTKMSSTALDNDPDRKRRVLERTPLGALGFPEDVANTAYFLVSPENAFITGAVIPVDGGNSIGF